MLGALGSAETNPTLGDEHTRAWMEVTHELRYGKA